MSALAILGLGALVAFNLAWCVRALRRGTQQPLEATEVAYGVDAGAGVPAAPTQPGGARP